jgi:hypothetical protein
MIGTSAITSEGTLVNASLRLFFVSICSAFSDSSSSDTLVNSVVFTFNSSTTAFTCYWIVTAFASVNSL